MGHGQSSVRPCWFPERALRLVESYCEDLVIGIVLKRDVKLRPVSRRLTRADVLVWYLLDRGVCGERVGWERTRAYRTREIEEEASWLQVLRFRDGEPYASVPIIHRRFMGESQCFPLDSVTKSQVQVYMRGFHVLFEPGSAPVTRKLWYPRLRNGDNPITDVNRGFVMGVGCLFVGHVPWRNRICVWPVDGSEDSDIVSTHHTPYSVMNATFTDSRGSDFMVTDTDFNLYLMSVTKVGKLLDVVMDRDSEWYCSRWSSSFVREEEESPTAAITYVHVLIQRQTKIESDGILGNQRRFGFHLVRFTIAPFRILQTHNSLFPVREEDMDMDNVENNQIVGRCADSMYCTATILANKIVFFDSHSLAPLDKAVQVNNSDTNRTFIRAPIFRLVPNPSVTLVAQSIRKAKEERMRRARMDKEQAAAGRG